MARGKKQMLFLIVAGRRKVKGLEGRYITAEGAITALRSRAAKFETPGDAKAFATHHDMRLGDGLYIGKRERS